MGDPTRVTSQMKELVGDTRRYTCTITGANSTGAATWISGGNMPGTTFRVLSMVLTKSAAAPFPTAFGVVEGSLAVDGFDIECDGEPGGSETWTFEGIAVMN